MRLRYLADGVGADCKKWIEQIRNNYANLAGTPVAQRSRKLIWTVFKIGHRGQYTVTQLR